MNTTTQTKTERAIYLKDYTVPNFIIEKTVLDIALHDEVTTVRSKLTIRRNKAAQQPTAPLKLNGKNMSLELVQLDGLALSPDSYHVDEEYLTLDNVPDHFMLETEVEIKPQLNKALSGLYVSRGNYCTQCESEGFRHITYFLDRPDVMTRFTTTITADEARYPVLLSNGNLIDSFSFGGRHSVTWEDPSLKPCYLFALVAGDYEHLYDEFITQSQRTVSLDLYVEKGKADQGTFALEALKRAMRWDEQTYGREYDLDIYMVVAVSDFNFGAMENKGLNIFNDKYILANPKTASDNDYANIEAVIGHEYFHNWSGNRVTCRDWFQISLKEGLTVFREQGFSADMTSPIVQRIQDARVITSVQFAQDAGPMAHPVRPQSYIEINNFYTVTVYEKGAEVIRMIRTLIGPEKFRQGMDTYFERHDGQAVTTDDFAQAMQDASGLDLTQFKRWYDQAGTPQVRVSGAYDAASQTYELTVEQSCQPTPGQPTKHPLYFPLAVGLLDKDGNDLSLQLNTDDSATASQTGTRVLVVSEKKHAYTFVNIPHKPMPSLLRDFSAPVRLSYDYTEDDLCFLLEHDSDGFNRWSAGQRLAEQVMLKLIAKYQQGDELILPEIFTQAFDRVLNDADLDKVFVAELLILPSENYLIQQMDEADPQAIHNVREFVKKTMAVRLKDTLLACYKANVSDAPYKYDRVSVGQRHLKNRCLGYLMKLDEPEWRQLAVEQFKQTDNMTDTMAALCVLLNIDCVERKNLFAAFYDKWQDQDLVIDKWLRLQATSSLPNTLETVKSLMQLPCFDIKNPNRVHSLIGAFCAGNPLHFHAESGEGYEFLADQLLIIDKFNAQLAARLVEPFTHWRKFNAQRQALMEAQLKRVLENKPLSKNVFEIVSKTLAKNQ